MNPEKNILPIKTAIFNKAFGVFVHGKRGILKSGELKELAAKKSGFSDFGDPHFEEGLDCLIEATNSNNTLNNLGRLLLKSAIIHNLSNRLLFINELKTNERLKEPILPPPVIITGLPRSGTTFLHRLLIQDELNDGIPLWEMLRPHNEPGKKDRRKLKAGIEMRASNFIKGNINHIHYTSSREPEECVYLFGITFNALLYWIQFPLHSYADWYIQQNRDKKYLDYSGYLRILQANHPGKRLVMKSPEHLGSVAEIRNKIPEAILIEIHRDPTECFNSMNSMLYNLHKSVTYYSDKHKLAQSNLKMLESELARNRAQRKDPKTKIIDVWYEDLLSDPATVVEEIYRKSGMEMSENFEQSLGRYVNENPQHKHGTHKYDSQSYGMRNEEIVEKLNHFVISR